MIAVPATARSGGSRNRSARFRSRSIGYPPLQGSLWSFPRCTRGQYRVHDIIGLYDRKVF
eukprot:scaffold9695_cov181-Amphora_coffeaeformis.AAC.4